MPQKVKENLTMLLIEKAAKEHNKAAGTFKDYADTNFRYLKSTGLISTKGRTSIALVPEKLALIKQLVAHEKMPSDDLCRIKVQCQGAELPTDDEVMARIVLSDLVDMLHSKGETYDLTDAKLISVADLAMARHDVEEKLFHLKEIEFANNQKTQVNEISGYLEILGGKYKTKNKLTIGETEIQIPQGEAPAYFEWTIWRAFLAINSLSVKPWEARRFQIDQDFLPVSTAPGGGADLIVEFEEMVIVVEVTLTSSSRQEAAEGEPVRRHVADVVEKFKRSEKSVYGLFMAVNIDTNTANTFRLGEWYTANDKKLLLDIIPLRLDEFKALLDTVVTMPNKLLPHLKDLFDECRQDASEEAPAWKAKIAERTQHKIIALNDSLGSLPT